MTYFGKESKESRHMYMYNIHFAVEQNKTLVSQLCFDKKINLKMK